MPTRLYRFHCVGPGGEACFDLDGQRLPTTAQVRAHADRVALALMETREADWTRWIVDVHDCRGRRILVRAFPDIASPTGPARREPVAVRPKT